jgi:hypothetical protein
MGKIGKKKDKDDEKAKKINEGGPLSRKEKRALKKMEKRVREDDDDSEDDVSATDQGGESSKGADHREGSQSANKKAKGQVGMKLCPAGHTLRVFGTPHDEYMCDATHACKGGFLAQGSLLFGCRLCDWDACEKCTADSAKEKARAVLKEEEDKAKVKTEVCFREVIFQCTCMYVEEEEFHFVSYQSRA